MPGIIGFPQLDPGFVGGSRPPEPEEEPATSPEPMPTVPDPAVQDYENNLYHRLGLKPPSANVASPGQSQSDSGSDKADKKKKSQKPASSQPSTSGFPQNIEWEPDISALGQVTFIPTAAEEIRDIGEDGQLQPDTLPESVAPDSWQDYTPLTQLQEEEVNHLLSVETDSLAREVLITLKRDGVPPKSEWPDFMAQYALWSWDSESDARAWATLAKIAESDWDEWLGHADRPLVEGVAQNLGDNTREGVVIIDAKTWDTLLDVTGVVGADGSQYVGLQDTDVEALKGLELVFVHNHTKEVGASDEDLESAFDAGAEVLIVITPSGREQVYVRGRGQMVKVRDEQASYEIALPTAAERREVRERSEKQAAVFEADSPEFIFRQNDAEVIANMDVNPDEIERYEELKDFVTKGLDEIQETGETELLAKIDESMALLQDIFGYTVKFHKDYDVEANVRLAMEQVHNLGTILFHFLNDLGFEIMQSTPEETIFVLGADERISKYQGLVVLPESTAEGDPDLKIVYLGSEIEAGTIGHEVAHEIDRRMGDYGTAKVEYEEGSGLPKSKTGPDGSLLWFMKTQVLNQRQERDENDRYNFATAVTNLREGSRAASEQEKHFPREIFADLLVAKVLGPLDEDFFSKHGTSVRIGFRNTFGAADIAIAMEQYFDAYAEYIGGDDSQKPETFEYIKYHHWQRYDELQWPIMPVQGDEE